MKRCFTLLAIVLFFSMLQFKVAFSQKGNLPVFLTQLNVPEFFTEEIAVTGELQNTGNTTVYSMTLNFQADNQSLVAQDISGIVIKPGEFYKFEFSQKLKLAVGSYNLKVWASKINGNDIDVNLPGLVIEQRIGVPSKTIQRRPLFEEFTSSTCGPCASFNSSFFNSFTSTHANEITLVKYQMNWPGTGDPYYTAEGGVRRNYYGVNTVPQLRVDGASVSTSSSAVNNALTQQLGTSSFVNVEGFHKLNGTTIEVVANFEPYMDYTGIRGHIVVFENETRDNTGGNGETSFKHVMMKMVPNAQGTNLNLTNGQLYQIHQTIDLQGTHIEDFGDLGVAIFLQNSTSKNVLQSNYSEEMNVDYLTVHVTKTGDGPSNLPSGTLYFQSGDTVHLSASSNEEWEFVKWIVDGQEITDTVYDFALNANAEVEAIYNEIVQVYSVQVSVVGEGSIDPVPGTYTYDEGSQVTFTATPSVENWVFQKWTVNGVNNTNNPLIKNVNNNLEIVCYFQNVEAIPQIQGNVEMSVFPNPSNGLLTASFENAYQKTQFRIINSQGQLVRESVIDAANTGAEITFDLNNLPNGFYFLQVNTDDKSGVYKISLNK